MDLTYQIPPTIEAVPRPSELNHNAAYYNKEERG
jgi:hypothetical protein